MDECGTYPAAGPRSLSPLFWVFLHFLSSPTLIRVNLLRAARSLTNLHSQFPRCVRYRNESFPPRLPTLIIPCPPVLHPLRPSPASSRIRPVLLLRAVLLLGWLPQHGHAVSTYRPEPAIRAVLRETSGWVAGRVHITESVPVEHAGLQRKLYRPELARFCVPALVL